MCATVHLLAADQPNFTDFPSIVVDRCTRCTRWFDARGEGAASVPGGVRDRGGRADLGASIGLDGAADGEGENHPGSRQGNEESVRATAGG